MGFSTPKEPFNLADFLSKKATHRGNRKIHLSKASPAAEDKKPAPGSVPKAKPDAK
jgi:hypothetical protein